MPLPPKLDQEIRSRFDELIKEGTELVSNMKINDQNEQHKYSSSNQWCGFLEAESGDG